MNRKVTIEIIDNAAFRFLRDLAAISLIKFTPEDRLEDDHLISLINEICEKEDTSLEPCIMAAQIEVLDKEDW